ncbi:MAG: phenylalanine--tRNA ligase subunit beta [Mycobacteriales bacterium]
MRVPLSWLRDYAAVDASAAEIAAALIRAGLEVEQVESVGRDIRGVLIGEVLAIEELTEFKKPIRFCQVSVGEEPRGIVCGASNFAVGDRVPVALPGAVLPGELVITARSTYGRVSDGMICSSRELRLGDDHTGILILPPDAPIGADVADYLDLSDDVLDIAVTPDRGYCLSVRGVAREAATAFGVAFRDPGSVQLAAAAKPGYDVVISDADRCSRFVARVVRGIDPSAATPDWMRRRLVLSGLRSISLAVDITNYLLLDLGQPLHAYDLAKLSGPIVVRRAQPGESIRTLDGSERLADADDLLITDDSGPIGIAGVMGGATTEVDPGTRDVLIESAHFESRGISRSAARHRLPSEASKRFERGVDTDLQAAAAERAVRLLVELGGGVADDAQTDIDLRTPSTAISFDADAVSRVGGRPYDAATVRARLADVGCDVSGDGPLSVTPPGWRPDLTDPIDLVEEVLRLEGYDSIPSELPTAPAGRGLTRDQRLLRRLGRAIADAGYVEVSSYPFVSLADLDALQLAADDPRRTALALANPVSDHDSHLRTTLLPALLSALVRNVSRGQVDVGLFELGAVYLPGTDRPAAPRTSAAGRPSDAELAALDAALPAQPVRFAAAVTGDRERSGHWGRGRAADWSDVVELGRLVCRAVGARSPVVRAAAGAPFHPGRCAEFLIDGVVIGHAGELHPRVVAATGVPVRTSVIEFDLAPVLATAVDVVPGPELSTYPAATVDVALVVDVATPAAEVESALRLGAGALLEDVRLFDVYRGAQVGEARVSLAYTLTMRAVDHTLTDEEVRAITRAAVSAAGEKVGAVLRGPTP